MGRRALAWLVVLLGILGISAGLGYYKYAEITQAMVASASVPEPQDSV
jgi:hypothetical protein